MKRRKTKSRSRAGRPKATRKKTATRRGPKPRPRKAAAPKTRRKRTARRKPTVRKAAAAARRRTPRRARGLGPAAERPRARLEQGWHRGLGAGAAGQAGDLEEIPRAEDVDSESVEELLEEGQSFEAGIVSGVEEADAGDGEVRTREVPEDDVPEEYRDED